MNIKELEEKYNLKEEQLLVLFDVLYQYHNYNKIEYDINDLHDLIVVMKYTKDLQEIVDFNTLYQISLELCDKCLILKSVSKKGINFIAAKVIRDYEFYKELEDRLC